MKMNEFMNERFYLVNERGNIIYTDSGKPVFVPEDYRKYYKDDKTIENVSKHPKQRVCCAS